jgi:hypothetical protein
MQTNLRSLFGGCFEGVVLPPKRAVGRPKKVRDDEKEIPAGLAEEVDLYERTKWGLLQLPRLTSDGKSGCGELEGLVGHFVCGVELNQVFVFLLS